MKNLQTIGLLAVMTATLILAWCSGKPHTETKTSDTSMNTNKHSWEGADSMDIESEELFLLKMIPHHQEAVETAKLVLAQWSSSDLKKIAKAIVDAQMQEINMLQWWLKAWFPNTAVKADYESMMGDGSKLTGLELDMWFAKGMIEHHEWAIHMAEELLDISQRNELVDFANNVISAQNNEIEELEHVLEDLAKGIVDDHD